MGRIYSIGHRGRQFAAGSAAVLLALTAGAAVARAGEVSAVAPDSARIAVLAAGADAHADAPEKVGAVPPALEGATLIAVPRDGKEPLGFDLAARSMVYVCLEGSAAVPDWLAAWTDTGMAVPVGPGSSPYRVRARRFEPGPVRLPAAGAPYFAAVRKSTPLLPRKGWVLLVRDMPYLREVIRAAPEYGINMIQLSHGIMMNAADVLEDDARRAEVNELVDLAHAYGVTEVVLWTHEINGGGLPDGLRAPAGHPAAGHADGNNPALWEWLAGRYERLFSRDRGCPEADGVVLTFSETDDRVYRLGPSLPAGVPQGFKYDGFTPAQGVAKVVNTVQRVLGRLGKRLYARTWGDSFDKWEERIIRDGVREANNPSVWIMNKNVGGIDWPFMDTRQPLIGTLPPQYNELIEFDLGFEYFAQSRATCSMAHYLKDHWNYALGKGADGAVARIDRGGGMAWYTANRVNLYAFSRILADPEADPRAVVLDWCRGRFPAGAAGDVADHYDDPRTRLPGDTRYMTWKAYFGKLAPITVQEALDIAGAAIRRVDRHRRELSAQTTLDTRGGRSDFAVLHDGIAVVVDKLGGKVPDELPPDVPAGPAAAPASSTTVKLAWAASGDNVGTAGYRIRRDGVEIGAAAEPSFVDRGIAPSSAHEWTVSAFDAAGNESAPSGAVTARTPPRDAVPPEAPPSLRVEVLSPAAARLTWDQARDDVGVTGYRVFRDGQPAGEAAGTAYEDTGLRDGRAYVWAVAALDADGNLSPLSPAAGASTPPDRESPTVPGDVRAERHTRTSARVTWTASADNAAVAGYRVYRDGKRVGETGETAFVDDGLQPKTAPAYAVSAFDRAGNESVPSPAVPLAARAR